ncbi:hypothetical protein SCHPADRAFT_483472 [Schizopora paradoxa]|uniref:Uncharacterized protein n=1 Tax=Schizopora paradoxa TaxID=27342 RepID=A0A0H2RNW3_9AGAM|nr:hypothetical protein SCHPADRAFT_483472 [Schizopora paradoxa]
MRSISHVISRMEYESDRHAGSLMFDVDSGVANFTTEGQNRTSPCYTNRSITPDYFLSVHRIYDHEAKERRCWHLFFRLWASVIEL